MEGLTEQNLFVQHQMALWQRYTAMQEDYLNMTKKMLMNMIMWSDLALKLTETSFNGYLGRTARWTDAVNTYQDNIAKTVKVTQTKQ